MKAFYSRPITLFGTKQEKRDINIIQSLGYDVLDYKTDEILQDYNNRGMVVFEELVKKCDILFYRSFIDLKIGAGVLKEVNAAIKNNIPVFELPTITESRILNVQETKNYLFLMGQR